MASRGLGKNLNALLSNTKTIKKAADTKTAAPTGFQHLALDKLQAGKYQPRQEMCDVALNQLADSIKQQGVIQPLTVRAIDNQGRHEIIAGERRWRASKLAGLTEVPVIVHQADDETAMALALIENLQREDLNPMDEARALQRLHLEFDLTHGQIAELVAKSRSAVTNLLRLMNLNEDVKRLLEHGDLEMGHARSLLSLDEPQQLATAHIIIAKNLSVREAEQMVTRIKDGQTTESLRKTAITVPANLSKRVTAFSQQLSHKIDIKPSSKDKGKGKLIIHYDDLKTLLNQLDVNE